MKLFRRTPDTVRTAGQVPWWVRAFTDIGRPLLSVVVLVLCAPGEEHLAHMAGWSAWLSWGMAGLLAAYAGIAAVVATTRPKGAPGKRSAVVGAVLALLLAMAAQPVSHLFVTGWLSAEPRAPWILVVIVSSVPPLVLGHLLHLAASPDSIRTADSGQTDTGSSGVRADTDSRTDGQPDMDVPVRPDWLYGQDGHLSGADRTADTSDAMHWTPPDSGQNVTVRLSGDTGHGQDTDGQDVYRIVPRTDTPRVRRTADGSVSGFVRDRLSADPDVSDDDLRTAVLDKYGPDNPKLRDTLRKAISRARRDTIGQAAVSVRTPASDKEETGT